MATRSASRPDEDTKSTAGKHQADKVRKDSGGDAGDCTEFWEDDKHMQVGQAEYRKFKESQMETKGGSENEGASNHSKKRGQGVNSVQSLTKKQKNGGGLDKHEQRAGDKTRVPEKGQKAQWEGDSGDQVEGEVVEAVYEEKEIEGEAVKASKEEPQIVVRDSSSGRAAVQDPAAVKFG